MPGYCSLDHSDTCRITVVEYIPETHVPATPVAFCAVFDVHGKSPMTARIKSSSGSHVGAIASWLVVVVVEDVDLEVVVGGGTCVAPP